MHKQIEMPTRAASVLLFAILHPHLRARRSQFTRRQGDWITGAQRISFSINQRRSFSSDRTRVKSISSPGLVRIQDSKL